MSTLPTPGVAKRDPVILFFLSAGLLYLAWYLLYEFVLHPGRVLDMAVIDNLMWLSGGLLEGLGYTLLPEPDFDTNRYLGIQGGSHLWIGDPCNGVSLFAVFLIFLAAYPGPWRHKLWFGGLGLLSIHLINVLRIVVLVMINRYDHTLLTFNHDYTFYVVVYGWVFALWYLWVKRFAPEEGLRPAARP